MAKTFSEKSFQTLLDRIESVGKNRFLPLSFQNKSFFYMYKHLLKEVKSRWFGIELSLVGKNCFLLFPVWTEIIWKNQYSNPLSRPTNWSTGLKFYLDIRTGSQMHYFFFDTFCFVRNILMLLLIRVFISRSLMLLVKC